MYIPSGNVQRFNLFISLSPLIIFVSKNDSQTGSSLVVQWLGLHDFTAKGLGSIVLQGLRSDKLQGVAKTEIAILEGELCLPVGFNLHFPDN